MDRGLMFGHQQQALGKTEHLPFFYRDSRIRIER
jgi:hypothetical protein